MKYTIKKSFINVIGFIWMPEIMCAQSIGLNDSDIGNLRDDDGNITRESIYQWLGTHTGDFRSIEDFSADIETDEGNILIAWEKEESKCTFIDCMYPSEITD